MLSHRHRNLRVVQLWLSKLAVFFVSFEIVRLPNLLLTLSDILFMGAAFLLLYTGRIPRNPYGSGTSLFLLLLGLLSVAILISSLFAGVPERALVFILQYFFAYAVLAYVVAAEDYETVVDLVKFYLAGSVIGVIIALYWFWTEPTPNLFASGNGRFLGMNGGANGQAAVIALSMPLLFFLWMKRHAPLVALVPALAILLYGLLATSSNNGLIALFAAVSVFFLLTMTFGRIVKVFGVLAIVVPLFLLFGLDYLPQTFHDRVLSAVVSGDIDSAGTYSERVALIKEAAEFLDETFIIGIGADQFRNFSSHGAPVHNTYLLLWTECGLISMIAWIGMIATIVLMGFAMLRTTEGALAGAAVIAVSATLLVTAMSGTHPYPRTLTLPLILALSLVVSIQRKRAHRAAQQEMEIGATPPAVRT